MCLSDVFPRPRGPLVSYVRIPKFAHRPHTEPCTSSPFSFYTGAGGAVSIIGRTHMLSCNGFCARKSKLALNYKWAFSRFAIAYVIVYTGQPEPLAALCVLSVSCVAYMRLAARRIFFSPRWTPPPRARRHAASKAAHRARATARSSAALRSE